MVTLGGVKASPSIVIASPSPINPISEKLWYTVTVTKVYRYRRLGIASLSLAFNKHPSNRPNIRITMGDSTPLYSRSLVKYGLTPLNQVNSGRGYHLHMRSRYRMTQ